MMVLHNKAGDDVHHDTVFDYVPDDHNDEDGIAQQGWWR